MSSLVEKQFLRDPESLVVRGIEILIERARGNRVYFYPKRVALMIGLEPQPMYLSTIRYYLDAMARRGLIKVWRRDETRRKRYVYYVDRESPLWRRNKK